MWAESLEKYPVSKDNKSLNGAWFYMPHERLLF